MDKKRYSNVADMLRDITGDDALANELEHDVRKCEIVNQLMAMRAVKGVTQADIASRMGCSQSRVSKLERGTDDDLRLADLRDYLRAINHDIMLVFVNRNTSMLGQIKWHISMIKGGLNRLLGLAKGDETIARGVTQAYAETLKSVLKIVIETAEKLPFVKDRQELPSVTEMDDSAECDEQNGNQLLAAAP